MVCGAAHTVVYAEFRNMQNSDRLGNASAQTLTRNSTVFLAIVR